jgi:hypothetical protein
LGSALADDQRYWNVSYSSLHGLTGQIDILKITFLSGHNLDTVITKHFFTETHLVKNFPAAAISLEI